MHLGHQIPSTAALTQPRSKNRDAIYPGGRRGNSYAARTREQSNANPEEGLSSEKGLSVASGALRHTTQREVVAYIILR